jgi:hypothetical protein
MSYSAPESTKKITKIQEVTQNYKPFWQPLFDANGNTNPVFTAKLCYYSNEFTPREHGVRFFPSELNNKEGIFLECYNWDFENHEVGFRVLYHLPYNPNWKTETTKYVEVKPSPGSKLTSSTYAIRLSDLVLINKTPIDSPTVILPKAKEVSALLTPQMEDLFDELKLSEMYDNDEDDHYSKMTIRDLYCMLQNIPMSNKRWLNQLIQKGNQWQQK